MTINIPNRIIILVGIAAYWVGKVATQIAFYPMYQILKRAIFTRGGYDMNLLFVLFATVYKDLVIQNIQGYFTNILP